jgi:hypothetical protein
MASVFPQSRTHHYHASSAAAPRLARAMSWHASGALLTFSVAQIAGVILLSDRPGGAALPFVALASLLLIALPFSRTLERRWSRLASTALPSSALVQRFRSDRGRLWQLALVVPTLWIASYAVIAEAAAL